MACSHPVILKSGLVVPCGKCYSCKHTKVNDWAVRMQMEARKYKDNCSFVTLTYNDESLPKDGLLSKRDYQLFLKRLRKQLNNHYGIKFRYFMCGEYGEKFARPHYHFIFFGVSTKFVDIIEKCWSMGFVKVLPVDFKCCKYVAKYCCKSLAKYKYDLDTGEVHSEFVNMSRRGAIGKDYLMENYVNLYLDKGVKIGSFKYALPRLYRDYLNKIGCKKYSRLVEFINNKGEKESYGIIDENYCIPQTFVYRRPVHIQGSEVDIFSVYRTNQSPSCLDNSIQGFINEVEGRRRVEKDKAIAKHVNLDDYYRRVKCYDILLSLKEGIKRGYYD